jgi:hypothetical protein
MVRWMVAFQSYALAAEATEVCQLCTHIHLIVQPSAAAQVWTYTAAMAHLSNCLEIAAGAAGESKRYSLAIIYDEMCRREWNQKASRGTNAY